MHELEAIKFKILLRNLDFIYSISKFYEHFFKVNLWQVLQ